MDVNFEISTTSSLLEARRIAALLRRVLSHLVARRDVYCLELATAEICSNIAKHARARNGAVPLDVKLRLEGGLARLTVIDRGPRFDPRVFQRPRFDSSDLASLPISGMGLPLVHDTLDSIDHEFRDGANHVTLVREVARLPDTRSAGPDGTAPSPADAEGVPSVGGEP